MAYKYPICDVFHWFYKTSRFFATEPDFSLKEGDILGPLFQVFDVILNPV
jgi:hypothetical protein